MKQKKTKVHFYIFCTKSGHSSHLPVNSNKEATKPYYYLLKDSIRSRLRVSTEVKPDSLTMPLFSSLPVFGFIHQNTAHVIDAATQTVFIFPISNLASSGQSVNASSLFVGTVNFNQYFVCASASFQGKTTVFIIVLGGILALLAFATISLIGHQRSNGSSYRLNMTGSSSDSSSSANSRSVSDTNKRRLKMMITEMGPSFKSRPCFNPVNYKVKTKKKKIKKKILKSNPEPRFKNKLKNNF